MLKLMKDNECASCPFAGATCTCAKYNKEVQIKFKEAQNWDFWGHFVTAFTKGSVVNGNAVIKDNKVYCASAVSPIHKFSDFISLEDVEITLVEQSNPETCISFERRCMWQQKKEGLIVEGDSCNIKELTRGEAEARLKAWLDGKY